MLDRAVPSRRVLLFDDGRERLIDSNLLVGCDCPAAPSFRQRVLRYRSLELLLAKSVDDSLLIGDVLFRAVDPSLRWIVRGSAREHGLSLDSQARSGVFRRIEAVAEEKVVPLRVIVESFIDDLDVCRELAVGGCFLIDAVNNLGSPYGVLGLFRDLGAGLK